MRRLTLYVPFAVLVLGTGLGIGLGLAEAPRTVPALADYRIGPIGHEITISATPGQRPRPASPLPGFLSTLPDSSGFRYELVLPGNGNADVSILVSPAPVSRGRGQRIIGEFDSIPQHRTTWDGRAADIGVIPCVTPAGSCPGFVGGFTVVTKSAWYNVFLFSLDQSVAERAIESIRLQES